MTDETEGPVWECVNDEREAGKMTPFAYTDYEHRIPDAGGYGVKVRVTIETDEAGSPLSAYVSAVLDDDGGVQIDLTPNGTPLDLAIAVAMTGYQTTTEGAPSND